MGIFSQCETKFLTPQEKNLHAILDREYTDEIATNILEPFLAQTSPVSLRLLDWTCVNWSKSHTVVCTSVTSSKQSEIYSAYRTVLSCWKRRLFDPFKRRNRILVNINGTEYETTLGQAHFTLWAYKTGVLSYALNNISEITKHMNDATRRQRRERKENSARARRNELARPSSILCSAYYAPTMGCD